MSLDEMNFIVTNKCNLDCQMCPQERQSAKPEIIAKENLGIIKNKSIKIKDICITGGEPTLYWEYFMDLIKEISINQIDSSLQVLTNGIAFRDVGKVEEMSVFLRNDTLFSIPIYSDIDSIHDSITNVSGSFWNTVMGIRNLAIYRIPIEIRIVLMKKNTKRIAEFISFIASNFPYVEHIALMGLEPMYKARENYHDIKVDKEILNKQLLKALGIINYINIPCSIFNIPLCHLDSGLWPICRKSISDWKRSYPNCNKCILKNRCGGVFDSYKEFSDYKVCSVNEGV